MHSFITWSPQYQGYRLYNLCTNLIKNRPIIIIRINPNNIRTFKKSLLERLLELTDLVKDILTNKNIPLKTYPIVYPMVKYLYFDQIWRELLEKETKFCFDYFTTLN